MAFVTLVQKNRLTRILLFMIASNSKLFTATSLAQLEYDKQLSLDDKITKYFPLFRLADRNTNDLVTIRDMLPSPGTKTFQGDFNFEFSLTRQQIMDKMKLLKPRKTSGRAMVIATVVFNSG